MNCFQKLLVYRFKKNLQKTVPHDRRVTTPPSEKYDYYSLYFKDRTSDNEYVIIEHKNNKFLCKDNYSTSIIYEKSEETVASDKIEIRKRYESRTTEYKNRFFYLIEELTGFFHVRRFLHYLTEKIMQFITNNRKVETRSRIKILKTIYNFYRQGNLERFDCQKFYRLAYSKRAIRRPNRDQELKHIKLILNSLAESKDLKKIDDQYTFTGNGLQTLIEHEETEQIRAVQNRQQWTIVFLTFGLLFTGLVQSNLLAFDMWLDFRGSSLKTIWQNNSTLIAAAIAFVLLIFMVRWLFKMKNKV